MTYRLTAPLTAIKDSDGNCRGVLVRMPAGSTVCVIGEVDGTGLVNVSCDGEIVSMFREDLEERADLVGIDGGASGDGRGSHSLTKSASDGEN
jgi:hypothetical protein